MASEMKSVAEYVRALANEHGVSDEEDRYDRMARVISGLSGDDVELDSVERLLVALSKKGIISGTERVLIHQKYLNERQME